MSAIAGIFNFNQEPVLYEHSRNIMKSLEKFPADDVQTWQKEAVFLGCHVQWITPESVGEKLPFYDEERKIAITADAIIDNRDELFERLQVSINKRKSITDSELILMSYQKWGEDSPKYLVGDFVFFIWDEGNQHLFGARDFSGSRTLYYCKNNHQIAFCTTIQPLLSLPYIEKTLNEQWMAEFLAIPGMNDTVDTSITVYKQIEQLPPSHAIKITNGKVKLSRYWAITPEERIVLKSDQEYVEAFRDVFKTAVDSRLRTNRNVGAHLSGGLDSGSVVSFAARTLLSENKTLHTYSYVPPRDFEDWTPKYLLADERPFIQSTVKHVGNIKDFYLDFDGINPLNEVDDWLKTMEMPYKFFANSNWIKGIFETAHQHGIGILLNGGRGNLSISWGPAMHYYSILLKKIKWIRLINELNKYSKNVGGSRLRLLPVIAKIAFPSINQTNSLYNQDEFPVLINPELAKKTLVLEKLQEHGMNISSSQSSNLFEARRSHFKEVFPWNTTGTLGAKLSLNFGLWKRDPTNDLRVIRFCLSIPEGQYVQNGLDRALIRRSTEGLLPDKVRLNQGIRGVQGADCVHRMMPYWDSFISELEGISRDSLLAEVLNMPILKSAISKVKKGPSNEFAFDPEYQILMRSLIINRFIKNHT
ncbi:lasso peptide isopeptide bond-forming cyclase [Metabacillus sp. FJAT-53654]|uniref:asparagine synthase (glutamine-hydrolyzing) n=1 Tax=Metabacillus rhizosphaerae TaxID=3117747 RepID=A0ABZ2N0U6_9BACI